MNPMETFSKLVKKHSFDLIWAIFGAKNGRTKWPLGGPIFCTFVEVVPVSLNNRFHMNPVKTLNKLAEKLSFDQILAIFGAKNGQTKWPLGAYILQIC